MKKRLMVLAVALSSVLMLTACGETVTTDGTETTSEATATTDATDTADTATTTQAASIELSDNVMTMAELEAKADEYVTSLGDYANMEIAATLAKVTDDDVEATIGNLLSARQTKEVVEGRALASGDIANINYVGKMDGEAFEGGTDDSEAGYDLEIGSGSFIPGFEDALIGMNAGETRDIDLVFPDEYYEELAGKAVTFTVTLNSIKEVVTPELTDEFVAEQEIEGVSNVEELRAYVREMLEAEAQSNYNTTIDNTIMNNLITICEYKDELPEGRINYYFNNIYTSDESAATDYGLQLEGYVMYIYGYSGLDQYATKLKEYASKSTQLDLAVVKILEAEGVELTDDDVEKAIEENYASYGCESVEQFKENYDTDEYKAYLMNVKVLDIIKEKAKIVEAE